MTNLLTVHTRLPSHSKFLLAAWVNAWEVLSFPEGIENTVWRCGVKTYFDFVYTFCL